jgi:hypothetical protein
MAAALAGPIAEAVGKIFGLGSSFVDKSKEKRKYEGEVKLGSLNLIAQREAEAAKSKRTMIYAGVAVFMVVLIIVGFVIYKKSQ